MDMPESETAEPFGNAADRNRIGAVCTESFG